MTLAVTAVLGATTLVGSTERLPAAFAGAVSGNAYSFPYAKVGESYWLGLPVMPMVLSQPVRITGVHVKGHVSGAILRFYDMPFFGDHVVGFTDADFQKAGLRTSGNLVGAIFRPGAPTHYGMIRMTLTQSHTYDIESIELDYQSLSGAAGSQIVTQSFLLKMCGNPCPH